MRDAPPSAELPADVVTGYAQLLELLPLIERIIRYAHFRGANHESIEDKVQKVMVRALDVLQRGEECPEGLTARVISIARNVASSERRTKRRTAAVFASISTTEVDFPSGQGCSPERMARMRELLGRVRAAHATMPRAPREVFDLLVFERLSHAQIAARLGITEGASRVRYQRAHDYLVSQLGDVVEELDSVAPLFPDEPHPAEARTAQGSKLQEFIYRAGHAWSGIMAALLLWPSPPSLVARTGLASVPRMAIASAEPPRTEHPSSPASLIAPPPRPAAPTRTPIKGAKKSVLQGLPPSSPFNETIDEADLFIVDGR